jgi:uncharacterized protein (DUF433 family)
MTIKTLDQYIEVTAGVSGGKPRVAGHRITVQDIAIWHERLGRTPDEIAAEYDLTLARAIHERIVNRPPSGLRLRPCGPPLRTSPGLS